MDSQKIIISKEQFNGPFSREMPNMELTKTNMSPVVTLSRA